MSSSSSTTGVGAGLVVVIAAALLDAAVEPVEYVSAPFACRVTLTGGVADVVFDSAASDADTAGPAATVGV